MALDIHQNVNGTETTLLVEKLAKQNQLAVQTFRWNLVFLFIGAGAAVAQEVARVGW